VPLHRRARLPRSGSSWRRGRENRIVGSTDNTKEAGGSPRKVVNGRHGPNLAKRVGGSVATKKRKEPKRFICSIDDSGGHAALMTPDGKRIQTESQPFVGVGSITILADRLRFFEARWNRLRRKIQAELGLVVLPPIHARWMWGTRRPDKHKNPYVNATNEQAADWLSEAAGIIQEYQKYRGEFGVFFGYMQRSDLQSGLEP
jgi:hypothetical protein